MFIYFTDSARLDISLYRCPVHMCIKYIMIMMSIYIIMR